MHIYKTGVLHSWTTLYMHRHKSHTVPVLSKLYNIISAFVMYLPVASATAKYTSSMSTLAQEAHFHATLTAHHSTVHTDVISHKTLPYLTSTEKPLLFLFFQQLLLMEVFEFLRIYAVRF